MHGTPAIASVPRYKPFSKESPLAVKAVFLVLAVAGMATLWMAVAADTGASVLVVANSLRLLRHRGSEF